MFVSSFKLDLKMISIIFKQSCHNPKEHYWSMSILLTWIGFPMKRNEFENKPPLKTSPPSKRTPPCTRLSVLPI